MAGKMETGFTTQQADSRLSRAYCEGMAHRIQGTALAYPITDNPYSNPDGELETAWDAGWTSADGDAPGALDPQCCALSGTVSA